MGRLSGGGKWLTSDFSKTLTIKFLKKYGYLDKGIEYKSGGLYWTTNGEANGNLSIEVQKGEANGYIRVYFTQTSYDGVKKELDYQIPLVSTPCNYGGVRWWFKCPCKGNRCSILYLQSNGIFASRKTLDLCYEEQKKSKRWRYMSYLMGKPFNEMYLLKDKIKYQYRNGKPTRKMRRFLKLHSQMPSEEEVLNMGKLFWDK